MPLSENGGGVSVQMPVVPAGYGGGYAMPYGGGMGGLGGMFGGDWSWILLLLLITNGGWGGFGMGGWGGMMGMDMMGGFGLYPWLNNSQNINSGFRDQMTHDAITSIGDRVTSGFGDVQTALCGGFGGVNQNISSTGAAIQNTLCQGFSSVNQGVSNGFAQAEIANNARQIADMQQNFAAQTANLQGFNALQGQLAQCCCDNRAATADLKYTVATENCADRAAVSDGIRDVIANQTGNTTALLNTINGGIQAIKDQLCQDKIDAKNDTIAQLRQELLYSRGQASQDVQTARLLAGQASEVDALYNRLSNCPVPTTPVYGRTPIFTCNNGCGCGNNAFAA